jgi:hypothetical protein
VARLEGLLTRAAAAVGIHLGRRSRYHLVPRHYYGPIPELGELPPEAWVRPSALAGIELDLPAQLERARRELVDAIAEFSPPRNPTGRADAYYVENGAYTSVDGEILYAVVRRFRPRRVIELGSGHSTRVLAAAARANARDGDPVEVRGFDPFPERLAAAGLPGIAPYRATRAQDIPLDEFTQLAAGDVLFIDTTHAVRTGGDVNRIILDVLPILAAGVLVHFHDIFLPWEYPRPWLEARIWWSEQYLLQAYLSGNRDWEVLFAAHALSRAEPEALRDLVPSFRPGDSQPSAFWIRRRGSPAAR